MSVAIAASAFFRDGAAEPDQRKRHRRQAQGDDLGGVLRIAKLSRLREFARQHGSSRYRAEPSARVADRTPSMAEMGQQEFTTRVGLLCVRSVDPPPAK